MSQLNFSNTTPAPPTGATNVGFQFDGENLSANVELPTTLPPNGVAGGDLGGSFPDPTVAKVNGAPTPATGHLVESNLSGQLVDGPAVVTNLGAPGVDTNVPTEKAVRTALSAVAAEIPTVPTSLPPSGSAGGDLGSSYPNPTVAKVNGAAPPTTGHLVESNGSGQLVDGPAVVTNLGSPGVDTNLPTEKAVRTALTTVANSIPTVPGSLPPTGSAGGDLSGSYPNPTVAKVNGAAPPTTGNLVESNSSGQLVDGPAVVQTVATNGASGTNVPSELAVRNAIAAATGAPGFWSGTSNPGVAGILDLGPTIGASPLAIGTLQAGDLILMIADANNAPSDALGSTWISAGTMHNSWDHPTYASYAFAAGNGADTVTVGSAGTKIFVVVLRASAGQIGVVDQAGPGETRTASQANDLLVCFGNNGSGSGQNGPFTVSAGETLHNCTATFAWSTEGISWQIAGASGSISSTMTPPYPANFATVAFKTVAPVSFGNVGDFYLNLSTGLLWQKGVSGWALVPTAAQAPRKYTTTFTSATSVTVSHALNTLALVLSVWDSSSPPQKIEPEGCVLTDANTVTLTFGVAQSGSVTVIG